jgi:hypothetical protein
VALAVCLLFDARGDRAVRRLWAQLEEHGIPTLLTHTHGRHVPHVSYAVFRTFNVERVLAAESALPPAGPVTLRFDAVGLFRRRRGALIAASTPSLLGRQASVVAAGAATGAELHLHYRPGVWLPHCSLATSVSRTAMPVLAAAAFDDRPLEVVCDRLVVIDSATGQRWALPHGS